MRSVWAWIAAVNLAFAGAAAHAAPLEAYAKLPTIEDVSLSPSGTQLAVAVTDGETRTIAVSDLATHKLTFKARTGAQKVRDIMWAGEKHLLLITTATDRPLYLSGSRSEWWFAENIDLATGKGRPLIGDIDMTMNVIQDYPVVRDVAGQATVFVEGVSFVRSNQGHLSLFRIDLDRPASRIVETGAEDTRGFVIGPDGDAVAREAYDSRSGKWALEVKARGIWRPAYSQVALQDPPYLLGLGREGKSVLYASQDAQHRWMWHEVRLDGATEPDPVVALDDQGPIHDRQTGRLIGSAVMIGDEYRYNFFDPGDEAAWKAVQQAFPSGAQLRLVSMSADRRKVVVLVDSPSDGPAYSLVDLGARSGDWIGPEYAGVLDQDVAPRRPVRFKARDGLDLHGYLTLPRGKPEKGLPLVVFPHGGPASRDTPGFDWWAQAMASRGYAVLQVNFRGSSGFGSALLEAGYGQWGRKMQTDLSDGVVWLAQQGTIDKKRVCIVGASYGGYAALAGPTLDPGVYRCAVAVAGVADLRRQIIYSREHGGMSAERYWDRFMGATDPGDQALTAVSPARQATKADAPILLIHGTDDTVVPIEQSRIMADALKGAGKPVEFVELKSDDHWLSRGATRLEMLQATMAFLEKNNPPN
jgi:dipeptidyl aminopeptidase/acylaminoacyl peptidase